MAVCENKFYLLSVSTSNHEENNYKKCFLPKEIELNH